ncbi:hypothetical protein F7725_008782, partial [Dissostichus mawsoni]
EVQQNIYDPEQEVQQNIYDPEQESRRSRREKLLIHRREEEGREPRGRAEGKGRGDKEAKEAEDKLLQEYQLQIAQQETKTQEEEEERSVKTKEEEEERRSVKPKEEEEERRSVKPKEERRSSDLLVSHPMVKVHVVEERREPSPCLLVLRAENVEHVLPIITQPFDFKKNKSIIPEWREQIISTSASGTSCRRTRRSAATVLPHRPGQADPWQHRGFEWWSKFPRNKYSSTLYVTVKGIALPEHVRYTDQEYFWICANEAVYHIQYMMLQVDPCM